MSEADLARDLHAVLDKVRQGVEVVIEENERPIVVLKRPTAPAAGRKLSECIALAKAYEAELGYAPIPDGRFADDVRSGIQERRDAFEPPSWE